MYLFPKQDYKLIENTLRKIPGYAKEKTGLTITTPENSFNCRSKSRTINETYEKIDKTNDYRSIIYSKGLKLAKEFQVKRVIDFGCGDGTELIEAFESISIQTIGIDFTRTIEMAIENFPSKTWIKCDMFDYMDTESLLSQLNSPIPQLFIVSNAIEHLDDPRPLLRILKQLLLLTPNNRLITSTPDRKRTYGDNFFDLPPNKAHVREWALEELVSFLNFSGFIIEFKDSYTTSDTKLTISLIVVRLTRNKYKDFLKSHNLPPSIEYLICTTEHGKSNLTGGIGSYSEEMEKLFPKKTLGICFLGEGLFAPENEIIEQEQWILPTTFFESSCLNSLPKPDVAFLLVEQIIYFYPNLKIIEYQDHLGTGVRIAQAKCAGLLPPSILTKVRCHGSGVYLENCFQKWLVGLGNIKHELQIAYEEKISIELADIISFATHFLHQLYLDSGYEIDSKKVEVLRYPFNFPSTPPDIQYKEIDTLIFFGRRDFMKGFPHFIQALQSLISNSELSDIKKIILLGLRDESLPEENSFINSLNSTFEVEELSLKRKDAIVSICNHSNRALCIVPYQSDNHPVSVLEVISTGCQLLAAKAGGIPELIPESFHSIVLCENDGNGIATGIKKTLSLSVEERQTIIKQLYDAVLKELTLINNQHFDNLDKISTRIKSQPIVKKQGTATVIVPCYNTPLEYIEDLIYGLNNQSVEPEKIIFIDDGSKTGYTEELESCVNKKLKIPFEIIRHTTNLGLPAAKNIGLKHVASDYVISVDSDNIPKTNFVKLCINYLEQNPDIVAVATYNERFQDKSNWEIQNNTRHFYRPLSGSVMLGQVENCFGDGTAGYNTLLLKEIGGWDNSDKSMWEDWALFLKITSSGKKIGFIPKPIFMYRVRPDSMLRVYRQFPAEQRLARNTIGLTRFDAFRLQGIMRNYQQLQQENQQVKENNKRLQEENQQLKQTKALIAVQKLREYPFFLRLALAGYGFLARVYGFFKKK